MGKLCSMHLAVPRVVAHFYHIHSALSRGRKDRAWISEYFHREIYNWSTLVAQTVA